MMENAALQYLKDVPSGHYRVTEIFGPTISGEGYQIGEPTIFVRFGGCDYRCSWCDSMHAVEPESVNQAEVLHVEQILAVIESTLWSGYDGRPVENILVTLSGGNPAVWDLQPLVSKLTQKNYRVAVETQGTIFRDWMYAADILTVSPKPPSSGMKFSDKTFEKFCNQMDLSTRGRRVLKMVSDDTFEDLMFDLYVMDTYEQYFDDLYLSVLTKPGDEAVDILVRTNDLWERLVDINYPWPKKPIRILPQLHVLLWGHKQGV